MKIRDELTIILNAAHEASELIGAEDGALSLYLADIWTSADRIDQAVVAGEVIA